MSTSCHKTDVYWFEYVTKMIFVLPVYGWLAFFTDI